MERLAAMFHQIIVLHLEAPSLHGIACTYPSIATAYLPFFIGRTLLADTEYSESNNRGNGVGYLCKTSSLVGIYSFRIAFSFDSSPLLHSAHPLYKQRLIGHARRCTLSERARPDEPKILDNGKRHPRMLGTEAWKCGASGRNTKWGRFDRRRELP